MPDLALFPVPLPLDTEYLDDINATYAATTVALGSDYSGDLISVKGSSVAYCIQRTLKVILTDKGSVPTDLSYGTNLIGLSSRGYNRDTLNEDIVLLLLDAENQCKKLDIRANLAVSSRLGSIELLDLVLLGTDTLRLRIGIKTAAGVTGSFSIQV